MPVFETLNKQIQECIAERGFQETPIQEKAIPEILVGRNTLVIAPTGTGKTEAALLPVLSNFIDKGWSTGGVSILYITPLRALNRDLLERITWWADKLGISAAVRHGDTPQSERTKQMKKPPQLLITTPETLNAILPAPKMGEHLCSVKYVIIDEVHELAADKRGVQLAVALERLVERASEFQRIALSATVSEPEKVAQFFFGNRPYSVAKSEIERNLDLSVEHPKETVEDKAMSEKLHVSVETSARLRRLKALVDESGSVLTFVNTREAAEMLSSRFAAWDEAHNIGVHHSSLSKDVRVVAEKKFKDGTLKGLIATSSLELGIDIGRIDAVAQYMSPRQVSRLIQRVGRSGHSLGRTPRGVIIAGDAEDALEAGVIAKKALEGQLEVMRFHEKPYDVLAHQLVGLALDFGNIKVDKAYAIVKRAHSYRDLTVPEFMSVLTQMAAQHLLWFEEGVFGKKKASFIYYFSNLSTIPDEMKFFVKDISTNRNIAVLDEAFVANNLELRSIFICKGQPWFVVDIAEKDVLVEPAGDISGAIPSWEGEQIPVAYEVAQEVAAVRARIAPHLSDEKEVSSIFTPYRLDGNARREVTKLLASQSKYFIPDEKTIWLEKADNFLIGYFPFGSMVNETLGKILAALVSSYLGMSVMVKADAYRIVFEFAREPRVDLIKQFLADTQPAAAKAILEKSLLRSPLFRWRFIHVSRRFGLIEKGADYQKISVRRIIEAVLDSPIYAETLREIFTEKLDIDAAQKVLERIQKGEIKIEEWKGAYSPMSKLALKRLMQVPEMILPSRPESELIEAMKRQVYEQRAKLFCTYCHEYFYIKIGDLPENIICPKCMSRMVTYTKSGEDLKDLYEKKRHTSEQKKKIEEYDQIASLVSAYGKRAVIALAGKGVGPDAATRILARMRETEYELFKDMLDEQKNFLRTKRYWA
jgi:ATP-dependent Lhr-like helicase